MTLWGEYTCQATILHKKHTTHAQELGEGREGEGGRGRRGEGWERDEGWKWEGERRRGEGWDGRGMREGELSIRSRDIYVLYWLGTLSSQPSNFAVTRFVVEASFGKCNSILFILSMSSV